MAEKTRTFMDPVHEMIKFDKENPVEKLALDLIDTQAFQRLRNIKQLGITSTIFPSATHSRFSHSLGTFFIAREMCNLIREQGFEDAEKRAVTLIAALLHDIGHGPYSHIFEELIRKATGINKSHEEWGAEIITQYPEIRDKLESYKAGFSKEVSDYLLMPKEDRDLYPSIISGSFDADRLDYMMRDRLMCGVDGSVVNKVRLLNSLYVFSKDEKLYFGILVRDLRSVEEYLNSRVDLYRQIYLHKREYSYTLSMNDFFREVIKNKEVLDDKYSPLEGMLKGDLSISNYLQSTDADMSRIVNRLANSPCEAVAKAAKRAQNRYSYNCIELETSLLSEPEKAEDKINEAKNIILNTPGTYFQNMKIKAYSKSSPIFIVDHRDNNEVYELSQVSESGIDKLSKRIFRAYLPNEDKYKDCADLIYKALRKKS